MVAISSNSIKEAARDLAFVARQGRSLRAIGEKRATLEKQADLKQQFLQWWNGLDPVTKGSLLGVGGGGLLGALSSLGRPEEERNTLGSATTGALAGGLLGLGGGLAVKNLPQIRQLATGGTDSKPLSRDAILDEGQRSGALPGTPAEVEDAANRLTQVPAAEAARRRGSGEWTPEQYATWARLQTVQARDPRRVGFFRSLLPPELGGPDRRDVELPEFAENPETRDLDRQALAGEKEKIRQDTMEEWNRHRPSAAAPIGVGIATGATDAALSGLLERRLAQGDLPEAAALSRGALQAGGDRSKLLSPINGAVDPANVSQARQSLFFQDLERAPRSVQRRFLREMRAGKVGPATQHVHGMSRGRGPDLGQQELLRMQRDIRNRLPGARASRGALQSTRQMLTTGQMPWKRWAGRGLLHLGLPALMYYGMQNRYEATTPKNLDWLRQKYGPTSRTGVGVPAAPTQPSQPPTPSGG